MTPAPGVPLPEAITKAESLPSLPTAAMEVLRLCREEDATLDDLAGAISKDPALSVKLMRYANSPLVNMGQEVTTLQRATLVLGMKSVQLMSLSFSLAGSLPREGRAEFDYDGYWRRSLACAVAGRTLSGLAGSLAEDEAFLCGLLSHIGQLVMVQCLDGYDEVIAKAGDVWPTAELEAETLGFDRSDVALALLSDWGLPPLVHHGVGYMHRPDELPADAPEHAKPIVDVLSLARLSVDVLCEESGAALVKLETEAKERLGLEQDHIQTFLVSLESSFREASKLLDMPMPTARSHEDIVAEAREETCRVGMKMADELRSSRTEPARFAHRRSIPGNGAYRDDATDLVSRAGFDAYLRAEVRARVSFQVPRALGVLLLETSGELEPVAEVLTRMTRGDELPAHFGDGSFAVLLPECTLFGIRVLADRILNGAGQQEASIHVGGACLGKATRASDGRALLEIASRYLKKAKGSEQSGVELHGSVVEPKG